MGATTAVGWFAPHAAEHRRDAPRHCPACGCGLDDGGSVTIEYWAARDRIFHTWCRSCDWSGDVLRAGGPAPTRLWRTHVADHDHQIPNNCPACGQLLDTPREPAGGSAWVTCPACSWRGDVVRVRRPISHDNA